MPTTPFTLADLMDLLVTTVGLPAASRTDDPGTTFTDTGLDSLAYLQLQTELQQRYGVVVDESRPADQVLLGDLVDAVNTTQAVSA